MRQNFASHIQHFFRLQINGRIKKRNSFSKSYFFFLVQKGLKKGFQALKIRYLKNFLRCTEFYFTEIIKSKQMINEIE